MSHETERAALASSIAQMEALLPEIRRKLESYRKCIHPETGYPMDYEMAGQREAYYYALISCYKTAIESGNLTVYLW